MAEVKSTILSGSILLPTTENTSSVGNIWFDGANVKYSVLLLSNPGVWSAGSSTITGASFLAGGGTQNAAYKTGGITPILTSATEEYNGTSWTTSNTLGRPRRSFSGTGTQDAGLVSGGCAPIDNFTGCTEEYNGTSWSYGGNLINGRQGLGVAGTQNAGIAAGGCAPSGPIVNSCPNACTEEYNGSSWSTGGAMICARGSTKTAGTQNSALQSAGSTPTQLTCTEEYNGTSWSTGGATISARSSHTVGGTQNAGIIAGGNPTYRCTECYDGSTWTTAAGMICGMRDAAGANQGNQTSFAVFGGVNSGAPSDLNYGCTEEFTPPIVACNL